MLVEEYIEGREFTVGILGNEELALPVLEVRSSIGLYHLPEQVHHGMTEYLVPAPRNDRLTATLQDLSLRADRSLRREGISGSISRWTWRGRSTAWRSTPCQG